MSDLTCPHCGKPGVSVFRKLCLGPAMPATCKACGGKVGVPYSSILAMLPFVAAVVAAVFVEPLALKAALWIVGLVGTAVVDIRWVPLEPR